MLGVATRRANAQGITNFETRVCSADALPLGDAAFDSISVRFGYMFFPYVAAATAEFTRVLRPGGRLCSSVWAGPGENPWTTIVMQAIAALKAGAVNDAAVAAYRLSVQADNPLSERRLAHLFGRTSRRWARARIADARQASPLPDSPSTPVTAYP